LAKFWKSFYNNNNKIIFSWMDGREKGIKMR